VDERQVLVDHGVDGDDGRPRVGDQVAITSEVHGRVHEGEHVGQGPGVLDRNLVPGGLEPPDDDVVEAGHDGEHRVQVLSLFVAVLGNLRKNNERLIASPNSQIAFLLLLMSHPGLIFLYFTFSVQQ